MGNRRKEEFSQKFNILFKKKLSLSNRATESVQGLTNRAFGYC